MNRNGKQINVKSIRNSTGAGIPNKCKCMSGVVEIGRDCPKGEIAGLMGVGQVRFPKRMKLHVGLID